jgi:hypothetical protein
LGVVCGVFIVFLLIREVEDVAKLIVLLAGNKICDIMLHVRINGKTGKGLLSVGIIIIIIINNYHHQHHHHHHNHIFSFISTVFSSLYTFF